MTSRRPTMPHAQGHALIEVLIAALIFGGGALAATRLNAALVRHAEAARQRSAATLLAQARLDELRALMLWQPLGAALPAEAGEADSDGVRGSDAPLDTPGSTFNRHWHIADDAGTGLRRIDVQVGWLDRDGRAEPAGVVLSLLLAPQDPSHNLKAARLRATAPLRH